MQCTPCSVAEVSNQKWLSQSSVEAVYTAPHSVLYTAWAVYTAATLFSLQCTCSVAECTLQVHCKLNSVAAVYSAHAVNYTMQAAVSTLFWLSHFWLDTLPVKNVSKVPVHFSYTAWGTLHVHCSLGSVVAVYTAQSMQSMCSVHCRYPAATLHVHCTSVWVYTRKTKRGKWKVVYFNSKVVSWSRWSLTKVRL